MKKALWDALRPFGFLEAVITEGPSADEYRIHGIIILKTMLFNNDRPHWQVSLAINGVRYGALIPEEKEVAAVVAAAMILMRLRP